MKISTAKDESTDSAKGAGWQAEVGQALPRNLQNKRLLGPSRREEMLGP